MEESSYRFVILFTYVAASLVNNIPMNTFSSTATIVKANFDLPHIIISLNYLICPISHAIMAFPVNWMLTKKGIRFSYYVGAAVMVAGVWLRTTLTEGNPYLCLLGSFMSGGSGLVIMNSASKITLNWFRAEVLTFVTFITVLTSLVSIAAGLFVPAFLVNAASSRDDFMAFLRFEAILITVPFLLLVIFIREKPKIPPSKAAEAQHQNNKEVKYREVMKLLFKNKNYLKMTASLALTFGIMVAATGILDSGLKALGYEQPGHMIANISIVAIISGIAGTIFYSLMVRKTKKYKIFTIMQTFGIFLGYVILNVGVGLGFSEVYSVSLISIIFGFNYFSGPSLFVMYGAQIAFPVDQASVAGYLISIAQAVGFLVGLVMVNLVTGQKTNIVILFSVLALLMLVGAIMSVTVHEDLRKSRFQAPLLDNYTPEGEQDMRINNVNSVESQGV